VAYNVVLAIDCAWALFGYVSESRWLDNKTRSVEPTLLGWVACLICSFGARFSNLTNRGIITRGPYRFVRHPAYVCKCLAWWLEQVPTMTVSKALSLTTFCAIYALRARTEERHLSADPSFRAYKKKTPWVLVPGIY
jgi:protein-S-isoprenylcysteine O-methyltransferase Ste14